MNQPRSLGAVQALQEQRAFGAQAILDRLLDGGAHGFHDFGGRKQAPGGGGHAFGGGVHRRQRGLPVGQRGRGVAGAARARVQRQQLAGVGQPRIQRVVFRGQRVDESGIQGGLGRQGLAGQHQVHRGRGAHQARRALRAARAGQQAQVHLGQPQLGARQRHAVVRGQGDFKSAAQRRAMQGRDHRFGAGFDLVAHVRQERLLRRLAELADVGARDEVPARAHQQDRADLVVGLRALNGRRQVAAHGGAQGVDRRVVQGDDQDVFVAARPCRAGACAVCHGQCLRGGFLLAGRAARGWGPCAGAPRMRCLAGQGWPVFYGLYSFAVKMS
ncbi:hypothetical protein D3C86_171300 [compost metagenome]